MSLLPADRAQYSAIIDGILSKGDLSTISRKVVNNELAAALNKDISHQKVAIKELILERFRIAETKAESPPSYEDATNGHTNGEDADVKDESRGVSSRDASTPSAVVTKSEPNSDDEDASPPKKKRKQNKQVDDAKLAAMLQAQENMSHRATRGGANKKTPKKVKKPRKKSEKKVTDEDDSGLGEIGSDGEIKEKVKKGGFHKQYNLSHALAELVGEATLSRPQVVKKIWVYIKANDLQDKNDKRHIVCDDKLKEVFKQDRVHMFTMNKLLGNQLYDIEEP